MQRKNSVLREKNGFVMILAIALIVLISTLLLSSLSMSSETSKRVVNDYVHEQTYFLAKSATEYALLEVSGHDRSTGCLEKINKQYPADVANPYFDINISIRYFGFGTIAGCDNITDTLISSESNGTMLIDVVVSTNDNANLSTPIKYHRRTIQKL